jgi:hypothetical protein
MSTIDGYPTVPTEHDCDLNEQDILAFEVAQHNGNEQLAERIKQEVEARVIGCGGKICVRGVYECGAAHGITRELTIYDRAAQGAVKQEKIMRDTDGR